MVAVVTSCKNPALWSLGRLFRLLSGALAERRLAPLSGLEALEDSENR